MRKPNKIELQKSLDDYIWRLREQTQLASHQFKEIEGLKKQLAEVNRRFDILLDGMCMGMKEANMPRRPA